MKEFRLLRADEIDCRISTVNKYGVSILLYKDARCDMNILDETVGSLNWQRHHTRDNANCIVAIWDEEKQQWIEKEDTGTESYTEKEKGLASDSFKRACFNFGIGRELYTAPFMWVDASMCKIQEDRGKFTCHDRFEVEDLRYDGRNISYVKIRNKTRKASIEFTNGKGTPQAPAEDASQATIGATKAGALEKALSEKSVSVAKIYSEYKVNKLSDLTEEQHASVVRRLAISGNKGKA